MWNKKILLLGMLCNQLVAMEENYSPAKGQDLTTVFRPILLAEELGNLEPSNQLDCPYEDMSADDYLTERDLTQMRTALNNIMNGEKENADNNAEIHIKHQFKVPNLVIKHRSHHRFLPHKKTKRDFYEMDTNAKNQHDHEGVLPKHIYDPSICPFNSLNPLELRSGTSEELKGNVYKIKKSPFHKKARQEKKNL